MAFGEILKQKRLELGWTKEYVAERTHLMVRSIDALETETHKKIPAPIYGRGFIKQYCKLLNIDPEPLLQDYNIQVTKGGSKPRTVTHPEVKGPPARPLEPIHTGAHRTLPPREPIPEDPHPITSHKRVEPAEATFTSVPKPEISVAPVSPEPAPIAEPDLFSQAPTEPTPPVEPAFTLSSDPLPVEQPPSALREMPQPKQPHRAIFSQTFEKEKRERTIVQRSDRADELRPREEGARRIFGPQEPVKTPPNPSTATAQAVWKGIADGCSSLVTRATRPKVERLHGDEGRYGTPRMFHQALLVFILLLVLTGVIFLFRYIFRLSDAASPEYGLVPQAETGPFKPRPVATPPESFFE